MEIDYCRQLLYRPAVATRRFLPGPRVGLAKAPSIHLLIQRPRRRLGPEAEQAGAGSYPRAGILLERLLRRGWWQGAVPEVQQEGLCISDEGQGRPDGQPILTGIINLLQIFLDYKTFHGLNLQLIFAQSYS
jgi:hypothetical protein